MKIAVHPYTMQDLRLAENIEACLRGRLSVRPCAAKTFIKTVYY